MANSKRRCKHCKNFVPVCDGVIMPIGFFCKVGHALDFANTKQAKARDKALKAVKVKERKDTRLRKESIKPKSKWLSELQNSFNKYVRLRDAKDGCISCDKPHDWRGQWHASHYFSRGHSSLLRFNLWNVHKSCSVCNSHLSGNIGQYTPRLINKIGQDKLDWLESRKSEVYSYDIEWIKRAIKVSRKAVKRLEKRL
jgi:hypothetical protein